MDTSAGPYVSLPNSLGGDVFSLNSRPAVGAVISFNTKSPYTLEVAPSKIVPSLTVTAIDINGDVAESATNTLVIKAYNGTGLYVAPVEIFGTTSITLSAVNKGSFTFNNIFLGTPINSTVMFKVTTSGLPADTAGRDDTCTAIISRRGTVSANGAVFALGSNIMPSSDGNALFVDVSITEDTFNTTLITAATIGAVFKLSPASATVTGASTGLVSSAAMVTANSYRVLFATTYRPVGSESWTMSIPLGVTLSGFNPLVSGLMTFTLIGSLTVQASGTLAERDVATGVAVISLTVPDAPAGNAFVSGAAFTEAAALLASGHDPDVPVQLR